MSTGGCGTTGAAVAAIGTVALVGAAAARGVPGLESFKVVAVDARVRVEFGPDAI